MDDELHRIKREFDRNTSKENAKLLSDLNKGVINSSEYIEKFGQQVEKINSANGAALAEYVAHRKVIDRKSTRLNSSHVRTSRMPSSA